MPRFLNTEGLPTLAIAVCDRCRMKRPLATLSSDPNFPGLRVCDQGCKDDFDPYRLPARKTENITLRFPRPDTDIAVDPNDLTATGYGGYVISTEGNSQNPEDNGNLDSIELTP